MTKGCNFAILKYSKEEVMPKSRFFSNNAKNSGNYSKHISTARQSAKMFLYDAVARLPLFKKPVLTYTAVLCEILGERGLTITLPITKDTSDSELKKEVYTNILNELAAMGICAVCAVKGEYYEYDNIIPAMSGFYVLPFFLVSILKRCAKNIDEARPDIVIIGDIKDLTLDILCVIAPEINNISIYTPSPDIYETVAEKFYADSGINIFITDKEAACESAHIVLNASFNDDKLASKYCKGAHYIDLVGQKSKTANIARKRPDMVVFDGIEIKADNSYISNAALEAALYANDKSFRTYMSGKYTNDDFYSVLDKINSYEMNNEIKITAFRRFGANI